MRLKRVGINYYLVDGEDSIRLTYSQFLTHTDLVFGHISLDQLEERVAHYDREVEWIACPYCEDTLLRRLIEILEGYSEEDRVGMHDATAHRTVPQATI